MFWPDSFTNSAANYYDDTPVNIYQFSCSFTVAYNKHKYSQHSQKIARLFNAYHHAMLFACRKLA